MHRGRSPLIQEVAAAECSKTGEPAAPCLATQHGHDLRCFLRVAGLAADNQLIRDWNQLNGAVGKHLVKHVLQFGVFQLAAVIDSLVISDLDQISQYLVLPE